MINIKCKKTILIFCLLLLPNILNITYSIPSASADDSTPSASIKEKLKALQEEIASKAAQLKVEVSKKLQNRAYIGKIKEKSGDLLTLQIKTGQASVKTNQFTEFIGKGKSTLKTLTADDYIAALGDVDDNGTLTAKRIIKLSSPETEKKTFFGQITLVNDSVVKVFTKDEQVLSISLTDDTVLNKGKTSASLKDLQVGKNLIISGTTLKSGTIEASLIYVLPYSNILKPKDVATPVPASSEAQPAK